MNAQTKISKPLVYEKIAAVQGALARHGIGKDRRNDQQNYAFRGIDDVYNALAPLLAEHQLCVLPRMLTREVTERRSVKTYNGQSKETVLFYVIVEAEFDFVAAEDGSIHTVRTFGEAMDSGDKATNKAMSAAYKYAAFMAFAIPTEGDNDADATSHTVVSDAGANQGRSLESAVSPDGPGDYKFPDGPAKNITALKAEARRLWREIEGCGDDGELNGLLYTDETKAVIKQLSELEHPEHRKIWEGDGGDNPGISGLITRKQNEYAQRMVDYVRAG